MAADDTPGADAQPDAGRQAGPRPAGEDRPGKDAAATLWQGRFEGGAADALRRLNDSLSFDRRMFRQDVAGSRAHAGMLAAVGLISTEERDELLAALDEVEAEMAEGRFVAAPGDEDVHTAVERRVTELTPAGAKLHTGRSRNDQVAADLRLWTCAALDGVARGVLGLQATLLSRSEEAGGALLPGYTHLQQAQPVLLAHHLLAHGWALARDVDRLAEARRRADVSPLGAGALAGSSLPLDPERTAAAAGFAAVFDNSIDAVADRDFVADALYVLAVLGVHLSRIGEELVLWSSSEFGFVELDDAYATGSSMMPQKKNPDVAELARAKAGRLIGHLAGLLATLKGLPLAYAKDLQEDKEPLFDAVDTVRLTLAALDGLLATARFDTDRMADAASSPYAAATDLAEWLVARGTPFRAAHAAVGDLVRRSLAGEGSLAELVAADGRFGPEAVALLEPGASAARRTTHGAGGPGPVAAQMERFRQRIEADTARLG
ncbi:MAG: argininosuccinate lyase [Acidimicrobiaceae bacterium]|nr:argininosuccinate lyase [Acidimicrobiaceae bacterium]